MGPRSGNGGNARLGAELLSHQDADGQWDGGAFVPRGFTEELWHAEGQPWTATHWSLNTLRDFGIDPRSDRMQRTVELLRDNCRWDYASEPFWEDEVEECINGRTVADGAYFGVDVGPIVERLVGEVQPDGGWNCERAEGSAKSSFHSTTSVLEGLLAFERSTGGTPESRAARRSGEEYLLKRSLVRRLSDGEVPDPRMLGLIHPDRAFHTYARALDYFRAAGRHDGRPADPRLAEAIGMLEARRLTDGRWPLDHVIPGRKWFEMETAGEPSRWVTLRALRILKWAEAQGRG